ncbi:MAG TPA: 2-C-methyl-D-erythritol 2,4-cyclodiphosphate synthase [Hyphomicrobiales bacterium]|nr:2-C-methyl-D-erythritol 2,4-cyclodiphosphate synthase [Hyphomicrobiales bacterium]
MPLRIGNGYDVHRFAEATGEDTWLTIGGIRITHECALLAHSDGDVLIHALCDALLGALALGDIGHHFPDSDPRYRGISSVLLLREVNALLRERGAVLGNADLTLVAQAPRFAAHIQAMRASVAEALDVTIDRISIKATTTEGLGFTGRREGIACYAVVLLETL